MHTTGWLGIALPALMAGAVSIGVTVAIERWGGRLGGLLGTLPSTIVPTSIGLASLHQGDHEPFRAALFVTPLGMLLNAGFLALWRALPPRLPTSWTLRRRLAAMTAASLGAWALGAWAVTALLGALRQHSPDLRWVGLATTALLALVGLLACWRPPPAPRGVRPVPTPTLLARGLMSAAAIATAMWLARVGGPVAAGMAATFPAIFLTTMTSLWLAQGEAVQAGAVGPMMLGSTSVAAYSLLAAWTIPSLGLAAGSATAWLLAAACVTWPAWLYLRRRPHRT
jgi:hypothetical protein